MPKPTKAKSRTAQVTTPLVTLTEDEKNQLLDRVFELADILIDDSFHLLAVQFYKLQIKQITTEINRRCPELYLRTVTDIYDSTKTILHFAAQRPNYIFIAELLNNVPVIYKAALLRATSKPENITALYLCAQYGLVDIARLLLTHAMVTVPELIYIQSTSRNLALDIACVEGHQQVVELLLNADPTKRSLFEPTNPFGFTPLCYAAKNNHHKVIVKYYCHSITRWA